MFKKIAYVITGLLLVLTMYNLYNYQIKKHIQQNEKIFKEEKIILNNSLFFVDAETCPVIVYNVMNNDKYPLDTLLSNSDIDVIIRFSDLNCHECNIKTYNSLKSFFIKYDLEPIILVTNVSNLRFAKDRFMHISSCYIVKDGDNIFNNKYGIDLMKNNIHPLVFCTKNKKNAFGLMSIKNMSIDIIDYYFKSIHNLNSPGIP